MYKNKSLLNTIIRKDDEMKQVPKMISTNDLSYLEDMFNWHFIACKKCYTYLDYIEDKDIKKQVEKNYKEHKKACETIIALIGGDK